MSKMAECDRCQTARQKIMERAANDLTNELKTVRAKMGYQTAQHRDCRGRIAPVGELYDNDRADSVIRKKILN